MLKKLADTLEVSTDYLLFESLEDGDLRDTTLYEKIKLVDQFEDEDREVILGVINAFLTKRQMWNVLSREEAMG